MGFECGFNVVPIIGDASFNDIMNIENYFSYINSSWHLEHYKTYEDYWNGVVKFDFNPVDFPGNPSEDLIESYKDVPLNYSILGENLAYWCSSGRYISDFILSLLDKSDYYFEEYTGVDNNFINKSLEWVNDELDNCRLVPVSVLSAFRDNDDGTKTIIPCDGIEVENGDGDLKRIYSEYEEIYVGSKGFDSDKRSALESFKELLLRLKDIDLNNNIVYFYRSY